MSNKNCILCKYKNNIEKRNENSDMNCPSLSNIFYGKIIKFPIVKQIYDLICCHQYSKEEKYYEAMDKKYGNCFLEDDDFKFIWGIKSWDDLSGSDCNIMTMNDIDIIYDKKTKMYSLEIETAYIFKDKKGECKYLSDCLSAFTEYMDKNKLDKNYPYMLFMSNPCTAMRAETIEELYMNFNIFVKGYCEVNGCEKSEEYNK